MSDKKKDGEQQTCAGAALLEQSGLVFWCLERHAFVSHPEAYFEDLCQRIHPKFGRMICWMNFSAGAEFFLKGICLSHSIKIVEKETKCVPEYPGDTEELVTWSRKYLDNPKCRKIDKRRNYGTFNDILKDDREKSPLIELLDKNGHDMKVSEDERCLIRAACTRLP